MKRSLAKTLFFSIFILELIGEVVFDFHGLPQGIWIFKPLLMPLLMLWFYKSIGDLSKPFDKFIMAALFFSWWGDIFLMPQFINPEIGFLLGLGSFLVAHIMYVVAFLKTNLNEPLILKKRPHLVLPFALFGIALVMYLKQQGHPDFMPMQIPVSVYAGVIMLMVITAIARYNRVVHESFKWVMIGALMFMFSDAIIAMSRFTFLFEDSAYLARLLIMPLYVIGQYFIAYGAIKQYER